MLGDMSESKLGFRPDRLQAMIERRGLRPGQMEYLTGVSQPTISLILNGKRPNPGAQVLARLAQTLGCSVDYLLGITDDPAPAKMEMSAQVDALLHLARRLPSHRQHDLVQMAETFARESAQDQMVAVLGMIRALGGEEAERLVVGLLSSLRHDDRALVDELNGKDAEGDQ